MFCISIALKDNPATWTLLFNDVERARQASEAYEKAADEVSITDDFGQTASIKKSCVAGAMFEDLDKSMLAHIERGLHNARTQAKAQQIAVNDPILKTAAMTRQGPALFDPQGNGAFHR